MRKVSKSRSTIDGLHIEDQTDADERPRRIPGATITSWSGSRPIDLNAPFEPSGSGPTIAGVATIPRGRPADGTVTLSDGSRITFVDRN